jgi:hypothetical protein
VAHYTGCPAASSSIARLILGMRRLPGSIRSRPYHRRSRGREGSAACLRDHREYLRRTTARVRSKNVLRSRDQSVELPSPPRGSPLAGLSILLCILFGAPAPLVAADLGDAEARYEQGDMAGAATLARALATAEGFALAARATLVEAIYLTPDADKQALVERAAADAEAALARDPDYVDAQLQLAIALGQLADLEDPLIAHVHGYARQGKALIDRALALDPDNAWAHALLAMWHLHIVARAGDALAASLYGASRATGLKLCADAIAAPDEAFALKYGCARILLELDPDQFAGTAEQALAAVKQAPPQDAADRLVQSAAGRLLAELETTQPQ